MRKKMCAILCTCFLAGVLSGCGAEESNLAEDKILIEESDALTDAEQIIEASPDNTSEPEYPEPTVPTAKGANKTDQFVVNPYFYEKKENFLQAKAKYFSRQPDVGWVEKTVYVNVDMLQTYEEGNVYKFTIDIDKEDGYFKKIWLNQYFYVTKDRIYIVTPSDQTYPFSLNDDVNMLDTDEKLVEWSTIVCQEDEIIEDQGSDYRSITKTGNQITYYAYSLRASGDVWWSMYYTWEEGRGLISCGFRHGPGDSYDITLYDIEELTVVG